MSRLFLGITLVLSLAKFSYAAIIVGYDFDDGTNTATFAATSSDSNVTASLFGTGSGLNDRISSNANALASTLDAEGNPFGTANQHSAGSTRDDWGFGTLNSLAAVLADNQFMTFSVSANSGNELDLTSLTFRNRVNRLDRGATDYAVFTSVDGFTSGDEIHTGSITTINNYENVVVNLSGGSFQNIGSTETVEFRIYIWGGGGNNASTATLYDKVILNGSVAAVPEPSSFVMLGLATGLAGLGIRRRRRSMTLTDSQ